MNPVLQELLVCPICRRKLSEDGDELVCPEGNRFPIVREIPRLFADALLAPGQKETAAAFGYSWTRYPKQNPYTEEQWSDWVHPLGPDDFAGRLVLDAGCGLAGFAEYARRWGASEVVAVDLSEAIDAAHERLGDEVDLVQADLHHLPFRSGAFDLAYSIGVLHHLPEPEKGFASVAKMVRPGGQMCAWVYGRENNGWIIHIVDPLRKHLLARLPKAITKWAISLPATVVLWPIVKLAQRFKRIPYGEYLRWLGARDFQFVHGVVFDHLVAPTSHYIRGEDFAAWFQRAGLIDVRISARNQNSWRGVGRVPEEAQLAGEHPAARADAASSA
ncbi:MAG TPA: methyltransferase domain-containing protein [Solirubrobacteraceae bacterium]|nr:methyltransferase domain-containing protein [Solirubrobacteraceae bacterium]